MSTITINGELYKIDEGTTLKVLLEKLKINSNRIAVAMNAEVVTRGEFETRIISHNDQIELIQPVAGG